MRFAVFTLLACALTVAAAPVENLTARGSSVVNPAAVTGTTCQNKATAIGDHDINVALLSICGGISGTIEQCHGSPASTTGISGTATLTLTPVNKGATLDVTKGRWEGCMRAARAVCGDTPFTSTCVGGTTNGNFNFVLTKTGTPAAAPAPAPAAPAPAPAAPAPAPAAPAKNVNPAAVTNTTCQNKNTAIGDHDINVALLSICGGISGTIEQCHGSPASTTGVSGTAKLALTPVNKGATLDVSKGRWEGCMRAARAVCGNTPFTSTCVGGTTNGNFDFVLTHT